MQANKVSKQHGSKIIVASKVYQVVYCIEIRYSSGEVWWQTWHLLKCPIVGFNRAEALRSAKEWKVQLGAKFQPVIIGEDEGDFESIDCDNLFGINAIGGFDAGEFEFPDCLLEEDECP